MGMNGSWKTLRQPGAPAGVHKALGALTAMAAALARLGHGDVAILMRDHIDVLRDFVLYEPKTAEEFVAEVEKILKEKNVSTN